LGRRATDLSASGGLGRTTPIRLSIPTDPFALDDHAMVAPVPANFYPAPPVMAAPAVVVAGIPAPMEAIIPVVPPSTVPIIPVPAIPTVAVMVPVMPAVVGLDRDADRLGDST
jgi:hypothetical protein